MVTFKNIVMALFVANLINNTTLFAMHRCFNRTRIARIIVPAVGLGTLYAMSDRNLFAQENGKPALSDLEIQRYLINKTREKLQHKNNNQQTLSKDKQDYFVNFIPREPESLLTDERYQDRDPRLTILERISEKWIGEIPLQIKTIIINYCIYSNNLPDNIKIPQIPNRILLHGHPGFGKTHMVHVIADELVLPLFYFPASIFVDKYVGETSKRIEAAFDRAEALAKERNKPVIFFIDEIDALTSSRNNSTQPEHTVTLAALLTKLEKLEGNRNFIIFSATNNVDGIDNAVKNRFSESICEINPPKKDLRTKLIKKYLAEEGISDNTFAENLSELLEVACDDKCFYAACQDIKKKQFSNREIKHLIQFAVSEKFNDCQLNPHVCNKHLCSYIKLFLKNNHRDFEISDEYKSTPGYEFFKCHNHDLNKIKNKPTKDDLFK